MNLRKFLALLLALSVMVFFAACSDDEDPTEPTPPVNEFNLLTAAGDEYYTTYTTASGGVNISASALFTLLTDGNAANDPLIIDYRSATEYNAKHIIGAINISLSALIDNIEDGTITKDQRIVNVCYTGQTASVATGALNLMGYDAQNLTYGMCGVTSDPALVPESNRWVNQIAADEYVPNKTAVAPPGTVVPFPTLNTGKTTAEEIFMQRFRDVNLGSGWGLGFSTVIANPTNYFIVNYWGADDYNNIGHIEGAYQFTPNVSLQADEMLKYLPTDKTIVIYCWTGQTSAQVVAYLRMLGYDAVSMTYGMNGCSFSAIPAGKPRYSAPDPSDAYSAMLE
jgi:rhodanese-related sulfurtransferase